MQAQELNHRVHERHLLTRNVLCPAVDHRQDAELLAHGELVVDEVHRPDLVRA